MRPTPHGMAAARAQRGMSIVELMIGVAIALFILATGTTLFAANLRESRSLLVEARLMQDLRSAADLIARDLRRAGHWGAASDGVWADGATGVAANPYLAVAPGAAASNAVSFRYSRDASENGLVDANEQFGYRLRAGVIEMQLGAGNWQALTDAGTLSVTEFSVTPTTEDIDLQAFCGRPCSVGTCPRQQVRSLGVVVTGQQAGDAAVTRSVQSAVRLRNDGVVGACPV